MLFNYNAHACSFAGMKAKSLLTLALCPLFIVACTSKGHHPSENDLVVAREDTSGSNEPLYPFVEYIQNQIAYVDTTPFGIVKTVHLNGKTVDSAFIDKSLFRKEAQAFLEVNPNDSTIRKLYQESSFNDLTISRITFSITALDKTLNLQQADILVNPQNDMVKNVILKKQFDYPDSSVQQTLLWNDKMQFQVSETISPKNKEPYTRVTRIVWDKPLE